MRQIMAAALIALGLAGTAQADGPMTTAGNPSAPDAPRLKSRAQVQVGVHDSAEAAGLAHAALVAETGDLLHPYPPVIIEASSGGRRFYRLRLDGFASADEARRLCSSLHLSQIPCIPVSLTSD